MSASTASRDILNRVMDRGVNTLLTPHAFQEVSKLYPLSTDEEKTELFNNVEHIINGYGFLDVYLQDEEISEIMINSSSLGFVERKGNFEKIDVEVSQDELLRISQKIAWEVGSRFDKSSPIVDAWLSDGSRFHGIMPPISPGGICITIRKFSSFNIPLEQFCSSVTCLDYLKSAVKDRKSIVVAGGTSTGKTTFLNALLACVSEKERMITIEETAELDIKNLNHVKLLTKSSNTESKGKVSLSDLVKASLRMRPDRIVIGEVRSKESFDLIQALNTGHSGSMCSIHANGINEIFPRMASLAMFAHQGMNYKSMLDQAYFGVDLVVYLKKSADSKRYVATMAEVVKSSGEAKLNTIYDAGE